MQITKNGAQASVKGSADYFTGVVRIDPLFQPEKPAKTSGAYVTFEPNARTAWHTHPIGQTLVIIAGSGLIQLWGQPIQVIEPGDVVWIPANEKHWHGASSTTAMTHMAIQEELAGSTVTWLEQVTDAQYLGV